MEYNDQTTPQLHFNTMVSNRELKCTKFFFYSESFVIKH